LLALYSEERHGYLLGILGQDPKTAALIINAQSTWMLSDPEQAIKINEAKDAYARRRGHPFDVGLALTFSAQLFDWLGEPGESMKCVEEIDRVGRENSLPFLIECTVPLFSGGLIGEGKVAEGVASLERGLAVWEGGGGREISYTRG
jgi:hypothetical protein